MNQIWYQRHWLAKLLWPLSLLYRLIILLRRWCYQYRIFKTHQLPVPVLVVGNLTVGGTGKTPLVIALVKLFQEDGFNPGVISRGYRGKNKVWPIEVTSNSDPIQVGDEPVLIARDVKVPVYAGPDRFACATKLLSDHPSCNLIISDDGLGHLALARDTEIVVIDGLRRFGNAYCLPAGPLREPLSRLKSVDFVVTNGPPETGEYGMDFVANTLLSVRDPEKNMSIADMQSKKIIAVAGIGNPDRFFKTLTDLGLTFQTRVFPDHYHFNAADIQCTDDEIVIMTEKDAVKCQDFSDKRHWYLKGNAVLSDALKTALQRLRRTG